MAHRYTCDICGEIIEKTMYQMGCLKQDISKINSTAIIPATSYSGLANNVKVYMLCETCHLIWEKMVKMRITEVEAMRDKFYNIVKETKKEDDINGNKI